MIRPNRSIFTRPDPRLLTAAVTGALALGTGVAVVAGPLTMAAVATLLAGAALVLAGRRIPAVFQVTLAGLLVGYLFFGKGFAYIGVGAAYVGEVGVALAVAATIVSLGRWRVGAVEVLLLAFIGWGAVRTVPYVGQYGPLALRDAVTWGYGLVAIGVAATLTGPSIRAAVRAYRRIVPVAVVWFPIAAVLTIVFGAMIPAVPGSPVPFIFFKGGDTGVHLAGIAAFTLVGLYGGGPVREALLWAGWAASGAIVAALNRGGMIAAATSALALLFVRRLSHWLVLVAVAVVLLTGAFVADPRIDLGVQRTVSFQQLVENVTSIFVNRPDTTTQATKEWRIQWWNTIIAYTIDGPYFWTGKGYGINLADSDGFQVNADLSLRAPHSAHFEILARSGVPGLALWILLQAAWAAAMLRAAIRARAGGRTWWLAVIAWLFVYWLAAIVNMSVDVYLGGPQGGIWFWAVFGAGLAVTRMVRDGEPEPEPPGRSLAAARGLLARLVPGRGARTGARQAAESDAVARNAYQSALKLATGAPLAPAPPTARSVGAPTSATPTAPAPVATPAAVPARVSAWATPPIQPAEQSAAPVGEAPEESPAPPRRRQPGKTAPDFLLRAPTSVTRVADDFFDGLIRRDEGDR